MSFFGKNLKKIRKLKSLSQKELADSMGLKRAALGAYEEGRSEPKIDTIIRFANYIGISIDSLLQRELSVNELLNFNTELTTDESKLRKSFPKTPFITKEFVADYLSFYAKKSFLDTLPYVQLPIKDENNEYRAYEINDLEMSNYEGGLYPEDILLVKKASLDSFVSEQPALILYEELKFRDVLYKNNKVILKAKHPVIEEQVILPESVKEIWALVGVYQKNRKLNC